MNMWWARTMCTPNHYLMHTNQTLVDAHSISCLIAVDVLDSLVQYIHKLADCQFAMSSASSIMYTLAHECTDRHDFRLYN